MAYGRSNGRDSAGIDHPGGIVFASFEGFLEKYANRDDVVVLAISRGGIPVAFEVARALRAPLDVFLLRKLGVPGQEELAFGAIASGGVRVLDRQILRSLSISVREIASITAQARRELNRRETAYRGAEPPVPVARFAFFERGHSQLEHNCTRRNALLRNFIFPPSESLGCMS